MTMRRYFSERPDYFEIDPNHSLAQGLVFAGLGRFPNSNLYYDSSLYNNTGTLTNMDPATDWVRELGRPALDFATDDYISLPLIAECNTKPLTLSAWVRMAGASSSSYVLFAGGDKDDDNNRWYIALGTTTSELTNEWITVAVKPSGTTTRICGATSASDLATLFNGNWHYVICEFSDKYRFWLDGVSKTTNAGISYPTNDGLITVSDYDSLRIGVSVSSSPFHYFNGRVSDPMIWSRALSPSEIAPLADQSNVMLSLGGGDPGLLRYQRKWWPVTSGATAGPFPHFLRRRHLGGMLAC